LLAAFGKAFKTPDLRKKIFFTLSIMALFRLGSVVPTPGVSYVNVQECLKTANTFMAANSHHDRSNDRRNFGNYVVR